MTERPRSRRSQAAAEPPPARRGARGRPALAALHEVVPHQGVHDALGGTSTRGAVAAGDPGTRHGGPSQRPRHRRPDVPRRRTSTTRPTASTRPRSCATSTTARTRRLPSGRVLREWELSPATRRSRSRPGSSSRPGRTTAASPGPTLRCHRGRPAADAVHQRLRAPAHDALPRHPPGGDGRVPGHRAGDDRARGDRHLRVRRRAVRAAPLPLPRRAAGRAHRPGHVRHVHRRPEAGPARRRRDGDGDARLQHHVRRRGQPALRGQRDPVPLHARADPGQAQRAGAHLPGQHPRVRPDQLVPPPRQLLRLLPDRHPARARPSSPTP